MGANGGNILVPARYDRRSIVIHRTARIRAHAVHSSPRLWKSGARLPVRHQRLLRPADWTASVPHGSHVHMLWKNLLITMWGPLR
jgi:hypothetical protein